MSGDAPPGKGFVTIETDHPIWDRFFTVTPLVVIGSRDNRGYNLAPKNLATPIGWDNFFGFVCAPAHRTYRNIVRDGAFTVSFPRPDDVVVSSLAAAPRREDGERKELSILPTLPAVRIDGRFLAGSRLMLECELARVVDGFGENSLVVGRIVAAHVHEDALRSEDRDDADVIRLAPLLAYLSPGRFAAIGRSYSFPFPAGFSR